MLLPTLSIATAILLLYFPVMSLAEDCDCKMSFSGLIVPLYFPPNDSWDSIVKIKHDHPSVPIIAIVNPDNGPGEFDQSYENGIQKMQSSGITVLGYVFTQYGNRNGTFVKDDIDKYKTWYHPDGIFFDEMSHSTGNEIYYSDLSKYAKSEGLGFTVGNSGVDVSPSYIGAVDNIVIYDNLGLPSIDSLGGWHKNYDKKNFSVMSYGVPSLTDSYLKSLSNYVGYVYVTDDNNQNNPWGTLSSYVKNIAPHVLTVNSEDVYGNDISGLYVELYQNGAIISGGFTPHEFTFNDTKKHIIHVENYGNYKFDHWSDNNSTVTTRSISISSDNDITAVYKTIPNPITNLKATNESSSQINLKWDSPAKDGGSIVTGYGIQRSTDNGTTWKMLVGNTGNSNTTYYDKNLSPGKTYLYRILTINGVGKSQPSDAASITTNSGQYETSKLTVRIQDRNGTIISNMVELQSGRSLIASKISPALFTLRDGHTYNVVPDDYGNYTFDHWLDTGSHVRERSMSITNDTSLVAIFNDKSPVGDPSTISVSAVDSLGHDLANFYVSLSQDDRILWDGYTPTIFNVDNYKTYQVMVSNYANHTFDHWSDGIFTKVHDVKTGNDTATSLVAIFK